MKSILFILICYRAIIEGYTAVLNPNLPQETTDQVTETSTLPQIDIDFCGARVLKWEAPSRIQKLMPYYVAGTDHDGLSVYIIQYGKWDFTDMSIAAATTLEDYWLYMDQLIQRMECDASRENDDGVVMIVDWDGFSPAKYTSAESLKLAIKHIARLVRANGFVKYGFFVNANFAAQTFIDGARPLMGNALGKFEIYGTQKPKWEGKLLRTIPKDQLPPQYGGNTNWQPYLTSQ